MSEANEPVSEQSEQAGGYFSDLLLSEHREVSGKSGVHHIFHQFPNDSHCGKLPEILSDGDEK